MSISIVRLQSCDGEIFETEVKVAKCLGTIESMLESCDTEETDSASITLQDVTATTLRKVLEWAKHHIDDPVSLDEIDKRPTDDISTWDAEFLNVDQGTLFDLIKASNFLDAKGLMSMACKAVADMMRGKTSEEIRQIFNIRNDFSADEKEAIRKEDEFCEEKSRVLGTV